MDCQILEGKKILVVDTERDVSNMLTEALTASEVVAVGNIDEARPLIAKRAFDLAILDAVGAKGCDLLQDCQANKLPAAILTPREVEVTRLNVAINRGATSFFPKDELHQLPETVAELLERLEKGKACSTRLFPLLAAAFREMWDVVCEETDRDPKLPRIYW